MIAGFFLRCSVRLYNEKCMCLSSISPLSSWLEQQDEQNTHITFLLCFEISNRTYWTVYLVFRFKYKRFCFILLLWKGFFYLWKIFSSTARTFQKFNIWNSFDHKIVRFVQQFLFLWIHVHRWTSLCKLQGQEREKNANVEIAKIKSILSLHREDV